MKAIIIYKDDMGLEDEEIEINHLEDIDTNYEKKFIITSNRQDEEGNYETLVIAMRNVKSIIITEF